MFASTLCKEDLFVPSWARVRRMCIGSVSSVVFIGGGGSVCSNSNWTGWSVGKVMDWQSSGSLFNYW